MERYLFYILASVIVFFALASVSSRKMLRSVIYLLFVLIGIAGLYFLIDYNFLAAVQLTVYAGGIVILIIFSVFLVHHIEMRLEVAALAKRVVTAIACLIGLGVFLSVIYQYDFKVIENDLTTTTEEIGKGLLSYGEGGFVLPFEVISVLLLAAMLGAIIIAMARKKQPVKMDSE